MNVYYGRTLREYRGQYPVTFWLITINSLLFLATLAINARYGSDTVQNRFGITSGSPELWRWVTYAFLHNGFQHYAGNNLFLYMMAPTVEHLLGRVRSIALVCFTVPITPVAHYFYSNDVGVVGSSGIVFAMLGIYGWLIIRNRDLLSKPLIGLVVFWSVVGWTFTFLGERVSVSGHVIGFLCGVVFSLVCMRKTKSPEADRITYVT